MDWRSATLIGTAALVLGGCERLQTPPVSQVPGYESMGHFRSTAPGNHIRVAAEVHDSSLVPLQDGSLSYDEPIYANPSCPDTFLGSLLGTAIEAATGEPVCDDC